MTTQEQMMAFEEAVWPEEPNWPEYAASLMTTKMFEEEVVSVLYAALNNEMDDSARDSACCIIKVLRLAGIREKKQPVPSSAPPTYIKHPG